MPPSSLPLPSEALWRHPWRQLSRSRCSHLQSPPEAPPYRLARPIPIRPASLRYPCPSLSTARAFATTSIFLKQKHSSTSPPDPKSKRVRGHSEVEATVFTADSDKHVAENDPFDFADLEAGIAKAVERLKDSLSKLRAGGRFNPETIEGLKVTLKVGEGEHGHKVQTETVTVGDLAQVVPKGGRMVTVLVGEEEHIKPISSAIQASNLSLTPQPDSQNPLQLNVPVPPPTAESRAQVQATAKKAWEHAGLAVRTARGDCQKRLRRLEVGKLARGDDVRKAHNQMEKIAKAGQDEAKNLFELAVKALERG